MSERMVLSISDVKSWMECPQRFMYRHVDQLGPAGDTGSALLVGTAVHKYLEWRLRGTDLEGVEFAALCGDEYETAAEETQLETAKVLTTLMPALALWEAPDKWEIVDVEKELRTTLALQDGSEVELVGKLDCVVRAMGGLWHLQHKTCHASKPTDTYSELMRTDWHEVAYQKMAGLAYPDEPFKGTILNCIRKLSAKRIAESPVDVFALYYLHRPAALVDEAWADIHYMVDRMAWDITSYSLGVVPAFKNRLACAGVFGNSLCKYKDVCDHRRPLSAMGFVKLDRRYEPSPEGD